MQSVSQNLNTQWKETDGFQQKGKHHYIFSGHDVKFEIPKGVLIPKFDQEQILKALQTRFNLPETLKISNCTKN